VNTLLRLVLKGLKDLRDNKWEQLLTLAAVILVTFLGGLFLLVIHNIQHQVIQNQGEVKFELYWHSGTDLEQVREQWQRLRGMRSLASLKTYTPDQALRTVTKAIGQEVSPGWLERKNPVPPTAVATFRIAAANGERAVQSIHERLKEMQGVEKIHYNPLQADIASSWVQLCRRAIWPFIGFLVLLVGLIVGNTIKLSQFHQREEIEVLRLVGAGRWYIRLPLLIEAAFQAVVGGGLALVLVKLVQSSLRKVLYVPPLWFKIEFLSAGEIGALMGILVCVALVSGWVAVRR
jgi:cell division transport system permease protein